MNLRRLLLATTIVATFAVAGLLVGPISTAAGKGKPGGGGGGGNANFAFAFEVVGDGLFLTTIDDGNRVRLTRARSLADHVEPRWSPDLDPDAPGYQGMIAYTKIAADETLNLRVVRPDGSGDRLLRSSTFGTAAVAWTPNGQEIVLADTATSISAVDVATGDSRVLLAFEGGPNTATDGVALSSLGTLAFHQRVPQTGTSDVYVADYTLDESGRIQVDAATLTKLLGDPDRAELYPSFSPDGTCLAYNRTDADSPWQIVVLDLLTDREIVVLDGLAGDKRVAWSPDGSQIATSVRTQSKRGAAMDLFRVTDWDDPDQRQVIRVTYTDGNHEVTPAWNPDWQAGP